MNKYKVIHPLTEIEKIVKAKNKNRAGIKFASLLDYKELDLLEQHNTTFFDLGFEIDIEEVK